jgi:parallel beta-helix repeat protein
MGVLFSYLSLSIKDFYFRMVNVMSNKFYLNSAIQSDGETAYIYQNSHTTFDNNIIYSTSGSDSSIIYFLTNINIYVSNNYIDGLGYQMSTTRGGAIYSNDFKNFSIVKNRIVNFKTNYGGAILIESTTKALDTYLYVAGNTIQNNEALRNGGGIYLVDVKNIVFEGNTFEGNSVRNPFLSEKDLLTEQRYISGGGIYYDCSTLVKCQMNMTKNNIFNNNYAAGSGGGIAWVTYEPLFYSLQYNYNDTQTSNYISFYNNTVIFV